MKNILIKTLLLLVCHSAFSMVNAAQITCVAQSSSLTVNVGNVVVQRDTPVGTAITGNISGSMVPVFTCKAPTPAVDFSVSTLKASLPYSGMNDGTIRIYKTNIPGVGIGIAGLGQNTSRPNPNSGYFKWIGEATFLSYLGPDIVSMGGWDDSNNGQSYYFNSQVTIKLYKTGDITSGNLSGQIASIGMAMGPAKTDTVTYYSTTTIPVYFGTGNVTVLACSIDTPVLSFAIGPVLANSFSTTVGTIPAGAQATVPLGLNCLPGANVNVTLSGTQNMDVPDTTSVLELTGQGAADVASGVGVQLLYNGSPLVLNNRIVLKQSAGGAETLPITARYYQTKTKVTAGDANATATLQLTYQ